MSVNRSWYNFGMSRPIKEVFCGRKALPRAFVVISFFLSALLLSAGTFLLAIDNAAAQSPESGVSTAAETAQTAGSDQANVQVDVNILPVLSLAVYPVGNHTTETDQVVLEPVSGGDLATNMLDLVVRTNVRTGYQLSIKDEDTTTALVHTTDSTRTIPALDASTNTASFPDNRWGYSVGAYNADNSEFHAVPATTPNLIAQSEELLPGDGETTTVTFGVKIDNTVVGGIYEDKVVFTASPNLIPSIFKVTIHYRFADGKCWMTQDLNFTLNTSKALTPADSDVPSNWTPNNNTQTSTGTAWETPSATTARSYTNGTRTYYNWYAATGGTTNASTTSGNATGSVCPKGFTLPASSDYSSLTTTYHITDDSTGSTKLRQSPLAFVYTGRYNYYNGSLLNEGSSGYYWSRTASSGSNAYYLYFSSSSVAPQYGNVRGNGYALRCVGR